MSEQALFVSVRLLDGRYHGSGTWPPSPFRLFQALVSAAFTGREASTDEIAALRWLEDLAPPIILTPKAKQSATTTYYVPRNGADAEGGDLAKAAKNRDPKVFRPWLFDAQMPLTYIWYFDGNERFPGTLHSLIERIYQLGRGIDMAFATADQFDANEAEKRMRGHIGPIYRSTPNGSVNRLHCPKPSHSFDSLIIRYQEQLNRLRGDEFRKPSSPIFDTPGYNCGSSLLLFDVVENTSVGGYAVQPLSDVVSFAEKVIDQAAKRLQKYHPEKVERYVRGRGATEQDKSLRVRVLPLPSIGFIHTPQGIRRVLVEIPADCPIPLEDIEWAFSGLNLGVDIFTGEVLDEQAPVLVKANDRKMLVHYGIETEQTARVWRTVTPVALPLKTPCEKLSGTKRTLKENEIAHIASQALRHSGLDLKAQIVNIQREPFDAKGERAAEFAYGRRFTANRLYHLKVAFDEPVVGPIVIGDGRYLGLGLMYPLRGLIGDVCLLDISYDNQPKIEYRKVFLSAVRRALMSLARDYLRRVFRK